MKAKRILRIVFAAIGLCGIAGLLQRLWLKIALLMANSSIRPSESISIGIIGGADGPTAIFVTAPSWTAYILPAVLTALGIWGFLHFGKTGNS